MQPVTPGNPSTNTPTPTNLQDQQSVPQQNPGATGQPLTQPVIQQPAPVPQGQTARPTGLSTRP